MEVEAATKLVGEEQAGTSLLDQSQIAIDNLIEESKPENQTNGARAASNEESLKGLAEQDDKKCKEPEGKSPRPDGLSKKVRDGQKWNDRPRRQYGNQHDRPHKRSNNKSDLVSQKESSDPVAIRKQVCNSPNVLSLHKN